MAFGKDILFVCRVNICMHDTVTTFHSAVQVHRTCTSSKLSVAEKKSYLPCEFLGFGEHGISVCEANCRRPPLKIVVVSPSTDSGIFFFFFYYFPLLFQ